MNRTVAIGYDGSADAGAALEWGLAFAARHHAPVRVVQKSDGTLYVLQGDTSWTLVPDQISDVDAAALTPSGEIECSSSSGGITCDELGGARHSFRIADLYVRLDGVPY